MHVLSLCSYERANIKTVLSFDAYYDDSETNIQPLCGSSYEHDNILIIITILRT